MPEHFSTRDNIKLTTFPTINTLKALENDHRFQQLLRLGWEWQHFESPFRRYPFPLVMQALYLRGLKEELQGRFCNTDRTNTLLYVIRNYEKCPTLGRDRLS
jgi:hypothetical protein